MMLPHLLKHEKEKKSNNTFKENGKILFNDKPVALFDTSGLLSGTAYLRSSLFLISKT
jgi:hypothetical protein